MRWISGYHTAASWRSDLGNEFGENLKEFSGCNRISSKSEDYRDRERNMGCNIGHGLLYPPTNMFCSEREWMDRNVCIRV
jgi:hypothetical protein